jgi:hypothetical protein
MDLFLKTHAGHVPEPVDLKLDLVSWLSARHIQELELIFIKNQDCAQCVMGSGCFGESESPDIKKNSIPVYFVEEKEKSKFIIRYFKRVRCR